MLFSGWRPCIASVSWINEYRRAAFWILYSSSSTWMIRSKVLKLIVLLFYFPQQTLQVDELQEGEKEKEVYEEV